MEFDTKSTVYKKRAICLQHRIGKLTSRDLFDFAKQLYDNCENTQKKENLLNSLKECLTHFLFNQNNQSETEYEMNNECKMIDKMYFNLNSMIDTLLFVMNQHILSFLRIEETALIAETCKDFYKIHTNLIIVHRLH